MKESTPKIFQLLGSIFQSENKYWTTFIVLFSVVTSLIVWVNYHQMFSAYSVTQIWQSAHNPHTVYQYLLYPFAKLDDFGVVFFIILLNTIVFVLFEKIAKNVGIGKKTFFVLFLLLVFSPELNKVRFETDPYTVALIFWLLAMLWFIKYDLSNFYKAVSGWLVLVWVSCLFSSFSVFWALIFPLCFLFWPGVNKKWHALLFSRLKFVVAYYLVITLIIFAVPYFRHSVWDFVVQFKMQAQEVISNFSIFIGDEGVDLSAFSSLLIALALIAFNVLSIANILMLVVLYFSIKFHRDSIHPARIRLFFLLILGFSWITHAIFLLNRGHFQESNHYLDSIILLLLLSSTGAYYVVQKIMNGVFRPQHLLIAVWLLIAFAIASMFKFGPTRFYQKEAGEWLSEQTIAGDVYSNSAVALYYAGKNPGKIDRNLEQTMLLRDTLGQNKGVDYFILAGSLRAGLPDELKNYTILKTFVNNRHHVAYVLQAKAQSGDHE